MGVFNRALRPRAAGEEGVVPNPNNPASVPPSTVGPDQLVRPGDPDGVVVDVDGPGWGPPPRIVASGWSGWPADWATPNWSGSWQPLVDVAWNCVNKNSNALATMPPYLVDAADTLNADWLNNPDPDLYESWEAFAKSLFWDYQLGEAFVLTTSRYATGWPARFHVVPPTLINVEMDAGRRRYTIGGIDVTADVLHIRYQGSVADAHGHGPLEAGSYRLAAAEALLQYSAKLVASGGIPIGVLESQEEISPDQALAIQQAWVARRMSTIGEPAVLDKGLVWKPSQISPNDMGLVPLEQYHAGMIANLFDVPAWVLNLPTNDSMTYANVNGQMDSWWRLGLKPKAQFVMSALSGWALPRGTRVELNRDEFVQPGPLERAQTAQILAGIVDPVTGQPALTVGEIRAAERLDDSTPKDVAQGVLR